jgi:hypothetical protein
VGNNDDFLDLTDIWVCFSLSSVASSIGPGKMSAYPLRSFDLVVEKTISLL